MKNGSYAEVALVVVDDVTEIVLLLTGSGVELLTELEVDDLRFRILSYFTESVLGRPKRL